MEIDDAHAPRPRQFLPGDCANGPVAPGGRTAAEEDLAADVAHLVLVVEQDEAAADAERKRIERLEEAKKAADAAAKERHAAEMRRLKEQQELQKQLLQQKQRLQLQQKLQL